MTGILSRVVVRRKTLHEEYLKRTDEEWANMSKEERTKKMKFKKPLKVIIMSATLRVNDFVENEHLLRDIMLNTKIPPPVINVEGRMFDVTVHYTAQTHPNYVEAAYDRVCEIHRKLPEGAILVFLTGVQEIYELMRRLGATFQSSADGKAPVISGYRAQKDAMKVKRKNRKAKLKAAKEADGFDSGDEEEEKSEDLTKEMLRMDFDQFNNVLPDHETENNDYGNDEDEFSPEGIVGKVSRADKDEQPLYVLPLYSNLASSEQMKVFQPPPPGTRLCVVSTNVAETSLTIPDVKYVIDSGMVKECLFDQVTGVASFHVNPCSKASAEQRKGRAGRVAPGQCFRLYSSAWYEGQLPKFDKPEVLRRPIEDVVLKLKSMKLKGSPVPVVNFPFPTPPDRDQLQNAIKTLQHLGALNGNIKDTELKKEGDLVEDTTRVTKLGVFMSQFPVAPQYAKMLCSSVGLDVWPYTVTIVAALTVNNPPLLKPHNGCPSIKETREKWLGTDNHRSLGDLMLLLMAVIEAEENGASLDWCNTNGIAHKSVVNAIKLRRKLCDDYIKIVKPEGCETFDDLPPFKKPSSKQCYSLRQIVLSGSVTRVAKRVDYRSIKDLEQRRKMKYSYITTEIEEPVYLPSTSALRKCKPEYITYQELFKEDTMEPRTELRYVTEIRSIWLPNLADSLCKFRAPTDDNNEFCYDDKSGAILKKTEVTFSKYDWFIGQHLLIPEPYEEVHYARFAYHLFCGDIFPKLKDLKDRLDDVKCLRLGQSHILARAARKLQRRRAVVSVLKQENVRSRADLERVWKKDASYLKKEFTDWLCEGVPKSVVNSLWPPIN